MKRRPFYEVSGAAYLFPAQSLQSGNRKQHEEPVRQWCAFELIRSYGIAISEIECERKVRVGSKTYEIDILVSSDGKPRIVVECKRQGADKAGVAMEQAISYANAEEIRAEFVLFTNGDVWQVKRFVGGKWVSVPDIPRRLDLPDVGCVTHLLGGVQEVSPLLYKLDERIEGQDARRRFLGAMQRLLHGTNLLTENTDRDLLIATDNLLRVLVAADDHPNYRFGKMVDALRHFEAYRKRAGFIIEIGWGAGGGELLYEMQHLEAALLSMIAGSMDIPGDDMLLLRLSVALLEYGRSQRDPKRLYPPIESNVHWSLREYLDHTIRIKLNVTLPDPVDKIDVGDMKSYCRLAWDEFGVQEGVTFREFVWLWTSYIAERLKFVGGSR